MNVRHLLLTSHVPTDNDSYINAMLSLNEIVHEDPNQHLAFYYLGFMFENGRMDITTRI